MWLLRTYLSWHSSLGLHLTAIDDMGTGGLGIVHHVGTFVCDETKSTGPKEEGIFQWFSERFQYAQYVSNEYAVLQ